MLAEKDELNYMGVTFSQIVSNEASVTLLIGESSLTLVYYPELITDDVFLLLSSFTTVQANTMLDALTALNKTLASVIKSWDAFEDSEKTVLMPIEEATFRRFSLSFKTDLLGRMIANIRPEVMTPQTTIQN